MRRTSPPVPWAYRFVIAVLAVPATLLMRRSWRGRENIPAKGGFVAAANHISNMDFLATVHLLVWWGAAPKVMIKDSILRVPVVGALLRRAGFIPVRRATAAAGASLVLAGEKLAQGECVLVYPEGTITKDPAGWPMRGRPGAAKLALDNNVPLIPIAQWGAQKMLPKGKKFPHLFPPTRVMLQVGLPIPMDDLKGKPDAARLGTERLMAQLTAMEAELRGETPPAEPFNQFEANAK